MSTCNDLIIRDESTDWPAEAVELLSELERACWLGDDRRAIPRIRYRMTALLVLPPRPVNGVPGHLVYTRDATARAIGFLSRCPVALGTQGELELELPTGRLVTLKGLLLRCRFLRRGWYECAFGLDEEQPEFASLTRDLQPVDVEGGLSDFFG